jgi:ABC-type transport system involved in cytochrome c biogenesis permease subunit
LIALLIARGIHAGRFPAFGQLEAVTWYVLALVAAYLQMNMRHNMRGIAVVLLPYVTALLIAASIASKSVMELNAPIPGLWLSAHVVAAFAGYALCTLASVLALTYLIQDYNLKHKRLGAVFQRLPALETLDDLMRQQIGLAFLMLSISIVFGFVMARLSTDADKWLTDPKVAATIATWMTYAVLLHIRTRADRHGRRIALATIASLLLILFTFCGVHLVSESLHDFVFATAAGN